MQSPRVKLMQSRSQTVASLMKMCHFRRVHLRQRNSLVLCIQGLIRSELGFQSIGPNDETTTEKKAREKANKGALTRGAKIFSLLNSKKLAKPLIDTDQSIYEYMLINCKGLLDGIDIMDADLKAKDKAIDKKAKDLPECDWWVSHCGLSSKGLGLLTGDAGDIARFDKESQLWKRMGMAVIDGKRQRRVAGNAEKAIEHGYNSDNRATMYTIVSSLNMERNKECYADHPWFNLQRDYKARKLSEGDIPCVAEARTNRRMGKRILRDLFIQVNG